MPSSAVRIFSEPDEYAAAIRATRAELTVTARGDFVAKLIRIDFHRLWMQRFSENGPRSYLHSAMTPGRACITFRTQSGPRLFWSGVELQPTDITRHSEGEDSHQLSSRSASFGAMSLPVEDMASVGATMAGCDLAPPPGPLLIAAPPTAMARLQRLHMAAGQLAEETPEIIANPDAARGLEQVLIEAMIGCLGKGEVGEDGAAQRQHELIMRRFRKVVEENPDQSLYLAEICKAIGVSDRTLRLCCQEHLGMGPKHYLLLRRMQLARRALRETASSVATVTEIATRYGFWHFGRFAAAYRSVFGEMPSATLNRPLA
jgi:AraC-like DNA-binding protein